MMTVQPSSSRDDSIVRTRALTIAIGSPSAFGGIESPAMPPAPLQPKASTSATVRIVRRAPGRDRPSNVLVDTGKSSGVPGSGRRLGFRSGPQSAQYPQAPAKESGQGQSAILR